MLDRLQSANSRTAGGCDCELDDVEGDLVVFRRVFMFESFETASSGTAWIAGDCNCELDDVEGDLVVFRRVFMFVRFETANSGTAWGCIDMSVEAPMTSWSEFWKISLQSVH